MPITEAMALIHAEQGDSPLYRALGWTQRTGATEIDLDAARAAPAPPDTLPSLDPDPDVDFDYAWAWMAAALDRPRPACRRVPRFDKSHNPHTSEPPT